MENLRRNFAEIGIAMTMIGTLIVLRMARVDDDDDKKPMLQFAINVLFRTKQDMLFYSSPQVFDNITRNILPVTQVVTEAYKALESTWKLAFEEDYEFERWLKKVAKAGIPIPQATLYPKMDYMINRELSDLQR